MKKNFLIPILLMIYTTIMPISVEQTLNTSTIPLTAESKLSTQTHDQPDHQNKTINSFQKFCQKYTIPQILLGLGIGTATSATLYTAEKLLLSKPFNPLKYKADELPISTFCLWPLELFIRNHILNKLKHDYLDHKENQSYSLAIKTGAINGIKHCYIGFGKINHPNATALNTFNLFNIDDFALTLSSHLASWFIYFGIMGYEAGLFSK